MVTMVKKPGRDRLQAAMKSLVATTVKVGYFADQGMHPLAKMNYPSLMYLQEVHGVRSRGGLVRRRVFEETMMIEGKEILQSTRMVLKRQLVRGGSMDEVKEHFGKKAQKAIQQNFGNTSLLERNAPATIKRKGFDAPLIETSMLKNKLTYRITKKGS